MNLLLFLAVAPGLFLMYKVYKLDKIEPEPRGLLLRLFLLGAFLVTMLAMFLESAGLSIVYNLFGGLPTILLEAISNFLVVACAEEGMKYQILKRSTWNHQAFNYRFDAIVYSVAVSLGFAVAENIMYVSDMGLSAALIRAVTAVPAHTIFAIFMGIYYGEAKLLWNHEHFRGSGKMRKLAFLISAFFHGLYDFLASVGGIATLLFFVLVVVLELYSIKRVKSESQNDTYIM